MENLCELNLEAEWEADCFLRAYILEDEQGGVGSRRSGVGIAKDVIVISLLVVTVEVILGEAILQGDQCD